MKYPLALVVLSTGLAAQNVPKLPTVGCPMSHCNAHLNDAVGELIPATGTLVASDSQSTGSSLGLGCSSNGTVAACSFQGRTGANLIVYDADGNRLFATAKGMPNHTAFTSAPIVFANGMVLIADNIHVYLFNADGSINWETTKPDTDSPISPVLVGGGIVLIATEGSGNLTTYDLSSGALLASFQVTDANCSGTYSTRNTPAVSVDRAYVVSACSTEQSNGALAAIDVTTTGSTRGAMAVAWLYHFLGPSGSSPLYTNRTVFFDGVSATNPNAGVFLGVQDTSLGPVLAWLSTFGSLFKANAAQDPRGGLWVFPVGQPNLYRLSNATGETLQTLTIPVPAGETGPYICSSAVSVSSTVTGDAVLTFGALSMKSREPAIVMAANMVTGAALWQTAFTNGDHTSGQFPIVKDSSGLTRVVFSGFSAGTYFLGEPVPGETAH